ncbi:MAG: thermonuclease family protein [Cyanobacteria bacterium Co-bin8]|nr:thermonuclease family protein [Cyanobacteria bacterium Co-bin8]
MPISRLRFQLNSIKDGDTLIASPLGQSNGPIEAIRLYGIDCPELAQHPYGKLARQRIQALLAPYRSFEVVSVDRDNHDRLVAELWVTDGCINTQLLAEGYAVAYVRHLKEPYRQRYLAAETVARKARLNFWSQTELESPWEYRRRNPRRVG